MSTSRQLDQFYTNATYAAEFWAAINQQLDLANIDLQLEPSAGCGSFYTLMDPAKRVGLDLDPQFPGIVQMDFFDWRPLPGKKIITIGNPPFGKNSSLAVKFFNHAAQFSQAIAFVLPRTFRKDSIQNRLNASFHLTYDQDVPPCSFVFDNQPYDVNCCAQIWVKQPYLRSRVTQLRWTNVSKWFWPTSVNDAHFAIQRVGARAGLVRTDNLNQWSKQSHWFIRVADAQVIEIFKQLNFDQVKHNTAGNPSISVNELVSAWLKMAKTNGFLD